MCGRFVLSADGTIIQQHFDLTGGIPPGGMQARYNIAPTQPVAAIANDAPHELTFFRWGLVPRWAKDISIGNRMINARAETLAEKNSFKHAYKRRRCILPANGFYEWAKGEGKTKIPMYIHLKDHQLFGLAGLWEHWISPDGDELRTCTIITAEPNELVAPIHNRMAVILDPADYELWLSPDELPPDALQPLLKPYPADAMAAYPVSRAVNSPATDSHELIIPVENPPQQQSLL